MIPDSWHFLFKIMKWRSLALDIYSDDSAASFISCALHRLCFHVHVNNLSWPFNFLTQRSWLRKIRLTPVVSKDEATPGQKCHMMHFLSIIKFDRPLSSGEHWSFPFCWVLVNKISLHAVSISLVSLISNFSPLLMLQLIFNLTARICFNGWFTKTK